MFQGIFDFFVGGDGGDGGGDDSTGGGNEPPALPPEPASGPGEKPRTKKLKVAEGHAGHRTGAGVAKDVQNSPERTPFRKSRDSNEERGSLSSLSSPLFDNDTGSCVEESPLEIPGPPDEGSLREGNTTSSQRVKRWPTNVRNSYWRLFRTRYHSLF